MAPFVPLPYGVQAEIVHQLGTEIISNRLWFRYNFLPFGLPEVVGVADGVALWWTTHILPYLSQDLITAQVTVKDWTADPPPWTATTVINVAGGVASESLSANVAIVVPFKWPLGIRLKKNKHYVAGVPESEVTLNTPSAAIRDALFEGYNSLIDDARLFFPLFSWWWVAASAWEAGSLRTEQLSYEVQGTRLDRAYILGQRRKRLSP